jgi:deoxyribonuclease IV
LRVGIHTSTSGSFEKAAHRAKNAGADALQIFSSSPRMWRPGKPDPSDVRAMLHSREKFDLAPLVIHDSYLINLASPVEPIRSQSLAAFRFEIERALQLEAEYLVMHPGNYKDCSLEQGVEAIVEGLVEASYGMASDRLMILLENTAGQGCSIGSRFEELAAIRDLAQSRIDFAVGFCIDTCHCYAAGMDISRPDGLKATVKSMDAVLGIENVRVIHTNDSKGKLGSHLDRHEHIGRGLIGLEGFRGIVNHPKLRNKPFILETPYDEEGDDRRNIEAVRSLFAVRRTSPASSKA